MASTINVRVDDDTKRDIEALFENLGVDTSAAIRMFLKQCLREQALPFLPRMNTVSSKQALDALSAIQAESILNGTSNMTLEEINAEISESRRERRAKQ